MSRLRIENMQFHKLGIKRIKTCLKVLKKFDKGSKMGSKKWRKWGQKNNTKNIVKISISHIIF